MMEKPVTAVREKFSSQASPEVLAALDEALRDDIDRQQQAQPRRHVMNAFASSLDEFDSLYRELAK
jgi:hypothetical protein